MPSESELRRHESELRRQLWERISTPGRREERLDGAKLMEMAGLSTLAGANLSGLSLSSIDLRHYDLSGADLRDSALMRADLRGAKLVGADLRGSLLSEAKLTGAELTRTRLDYKTALAGSISLRESPILAVYGLPSGPMTCWPIYPRGWYLHVGCWFGTVGELRDLIADQEADWPEAEGEERTRREPLLLTLCALLDQHMAYWGDNPLGHE